MNDKIIIYTDGSCDKNPGGNGGFSSIIFIDENPIFLTGYESNTTNQRMEMKAVIQSLAYIDSIIDKNKEIVICSDSAYVCNCILQGWYKNWYRNDWINSKGEKVANQDLWEEMLKYVLQYPNIKFIKVKGHSDNIFNNKCDEMAKDVVSFKKLIDTSINSKR